jgi:[protein-PII] uridylyltransferase
LGGQPPLSVVAVGGYGRGDLSPHSDVDLLFLVAPKSDVTKGTLRGLLYPLWDAGWQVGHATRTPKQTIEHVTDDLDAATAILSARLITGGNELYEEFQDRLERHIAKNAKTLARKIVDATAERHRRVDRAGWVLAPDLKEDIGGLRDLHRLLWLQRLAGEAADLPPDLARAGDVLLAAREALHGEVRRKTDELRIDLQPLVAGRLGLSGENPASDLMFEVHSSARTIEHEGSLEAARLVGSLVSGPRRSGWVERLGGGVKVEDGALTFALQSASIDTASCLHLIAAYSRTGRPIDPKAVKALKAYFSRETPDSWTAEMRKTFFEILKGEHSVRALETLDQIDAWDVLVPEWKRVRGLAQHDPYHRYTVDAHLFVTVSEVRRTLLTDPVAASAAREAGREEPLWMAALLHDVGKGSGMDHSVAGEKIARQICTRIGLESETIDDIEALVRWHLLLVDTATRRDLDDGAVIQDVAEKIADGARLRLLYVLSVADGRATGPEGWSPWKGALVQELYRKALVALETGELPARSDVTARAREIEAYEPALAGRSEEILATLPPSYLDSTTIPDMVDDIRLLQRPPRRGEVTHHVYEGLEAGEAAVTVCVIDRPGTLARTAGVLALNRFSVLRAQAFSTSTGLALERFVVRLPDDPPWESFGRDLEAIYSGRLALEARLEKKIRDYKPPARMEAEVRVLQDASPHSTVIEVRVPDAMGLLYAIASALTELDLDIHVAKIDTLGRRVVDVFYVRNAFGEKLSPAQSAEVTRSIRHRIRRLFG